MTQSDICLKLGIVTGLLIRLRMWGGTTGEMHEMLSTVDEALVYLKELSQHCYEQEKEIEL